MPFMARIDLYRLIDLFNWQTGPYPTDVVFCGRAGVAPLLRLALGGKVPEHEMPVVILETRVYGPEALTSASHNAVTPAQIAIRAAGYASCFGMYLIQRDKDAALNAAAQYLQPGLLDRWDSHSFVVNNPIVLPANPNMPAAKPDRPKRILYAGRLNTNKRWQELLEAFGSVMQSRPTGDVEVWVHAGTGASQKIGDAKDHRWHRTTEKLSYDEYWDLIHGTHVGAYLSNDEGSPGTVQELLLAGVSMALPNKPWVDHLFRPLVYPYQATIGEMPALIDWLLDNHDEAYRVLTPIREFIQREHGWDAFTRDFGRLMAAVEQQHVRPDPGRNARKVLAEHLGGEASFDVLLRTMNMHNSAMPGLAAAGGAYATYRGVRDFDDHEHGIPYLRRAA